MPYADFWGLSLRESDLISKAVLAREKNRVERDRILNQELAHLISYAYHQPDKMPDLVKEAASQGKKTPEQGAADMRAALLAWKHQEDIRCRQ